MANLLRLIPREERLLSVIPEFDIFGRIFDDLELPAVFARDGGVAPAFDVAETDKAYTITGEIPGIEAKDLKVTYADGMLHIRGEKRREKEEKDERYYRVEREYGTFHRDFCLPEDVMADKVEAMYRDGVLKINLPRTEIETKKIEVKEEKAEEKRETKVEVK